MSKHDTTLPVTRWEVPPRKKRKKWIVFINFSAFILNLFFHTFLHKMPSASSSPS
ncbi:hypothetical protein RO3G_06440 [Rhizopus delemar RA 99-880]|uniref:Uncharacterized protein n=1 Tax=Rhizopus delemar (strain RA 99-880 / ATCC MYA-4621 / FGSC 9543 / NRRL 43880) TaxID=246409 RepID=I1BZV5_RHIO9|nr:hypothetical protein RO3G_06440 [Rhizopus delemar RA 99-880]|eukprot:EIE81735.1 hypothetical protein RO3G_06440 [Rhizopus delemar RA 99-880]